MIGYIIRRLINGLVLLLIVTAIVFGIFYLVPWFTHTDPAALYAGKASSKEALQGIRIKFGFDLPLWEQYLQFVKGLFAGRWFVDGPDRTFCAAPCFGYSFKNDIPVWPLLLNRLPVTASEAVGAAILWLVGGVTIGVISAVRRGTVIDRASMITALAGVSLPVYFTGLLGAEIFVWQLHWVPDPTYVPITQNPASWAYNMILPWTVLAFLYAATYARLTRANMLDVMGEDYIRTARAKGLTEPAVITKHALRSSLTPILTIFGLDLGALLGGAILTESTFGLVGLGKTAIDAINQQDLPVVLGVTLFGAFFIIMANLVVDVLYGVVDPRVRY